MEHALLRFTIVEHDEPVVHNPARGDEVHRDCWKFCLEILVIAEMQLISLVVAEYCDLHTRLYTLQQTRRLDVDVIVDDVYRLQGNLERPPLTPFVWIDIEFLGIDS